jgi:hypothetical protein
MSPACSSPRKDKPCSEDVPLSNIEIPRSFFHVESNSWTSHVVVPFTLNLSRSSHVPSAIYSVCHSRNGHVCKTMREIKNAKVIANARSSNDAKEKAP